MKRSPLLHHAEAFIGRSAALVAHPFAAWCSPSKADRTVLLVSYFAIGYLFVSALLRAIAA